MPKKGNPKRFTLRHIIIKLSKVKRKRNLKAAKEKQLVMYNNTQKSTPNGFGIECKTWPETIKLLERNIEDKLFGNDCFEFDTESKGNKSKNK